MSDRRMLPAAVLTAAYAAVRLYWAAGGRLGYTACDRTESPPPEAVATGCGGADAGPLPLPAGWGAVLLAVAAAVVTAVHVRRATALTTASTWAVAACFVLLAFPAHLVFEIPGALLGHPADVRDLVHRTAQFAVGAAAGHAAWRTRPRCPHRPRAAAPPRWTRAATYAAAAVPVVGFSVPHALWSAGVPFGMDPAVLPGFRAGIDAFWIAAVCGVPALGGLLTLGLSARWGRRIGPWNVPRALALVPAAIVAAALTVYGILGLGVLAADLAAGATTWERLGESWAVNGTEIVFLAWGVALGVATWGYAVRTRCGECVGEALGRGDGGGRLGE